MIVLRLKETDEKKCPHCGSEKIVFKDIVWQCENKSCNAWFQIIITKYDEPDTKPIKH